MKTGISKWIKFAFLLPVLAIASTVGVLMIIKPAKACCQVTASENSFSVMTAELGQIYNFAIDSQSGLGTSNRTWTARYGSITQSGVYTAPSFMPPDGIDVIDVTFESGTTDQITLRLSQRTGTTVASAIIVPQGFLPVASGADTEVPSGPTPVTSAQTTVVNPESSNDPGDVAVAPATEEPVAYATALNSLPSDGNWHEVAESGTTINVPAVIAGCEELVQVTQAGEAYYRVPSSLNQATPLTSVILLSSSSPGLADDQVGRRKCKIGPIYGVPTWIGDDCIEGTYARVYGPLKTYCKRGDTMQGGSVDVNTEWAAKILKRFNITVSVGVHSVTSRLFLTWSEVRNYDRYKCERGLWTYVGSGSRQRQGTGMQTVPIWGGWVLGYPSSGMPGPWTDWYDTPLP
jgi:hypothetical protein